VDYGQYIHWAGNEPSVGLGPYETDLKISGHLAFALANPGNAYAYLQVVDISEPTSPTLLGSVQLPRTPVPDVTHATGVTVVGTLAYVTAAYGGLYVIDVSNPSSPNIVGHLDTPGVAEDVAVTGSTGYVADYSAGLQVIDVSNPAAPAIIGTVDTPGNAFGVALSGSIAYVADEFAGVHVIDVSNSHVPVILGTVANPGTLQIPGNAQDLVAVDTHVYVADGKSGLLVIDASNPHSPALIGSVDTPGYTWDLSVDGTRAYVADDAGGLSIIDVSDPIAPTIVETKLSPQNLRAVAVSGTTGFVLDQAYGLETIDLTRLTPVPVVGNLDLSPDMYPPEALAISGSIAYVLDDSELVTIDVSNPASPQELGRIRAPGGLSRFSDVAVSGTIAYAPYYVFVPPVGPDYGGLLIIDVSTPSSPQILANVDLPPTLSVAVSGTYVFVSASGQFPGGTPAITGLWVIDASDPVHPILIGGTSPSYGLFHTGQITVSGSFAYISHTDGVRGRIDVVNIFNPTTPTLTGGIDFPDWEVGRIKISGDYGYTPVYKQGIGGFQNGVAVLQVFPSRAAPQLLSIVYTPGGNGGLDVSGTKIYAPLGWNGYYAQLGGGLCVIDASTPTAPKVIGTSDVRAINVIVSGSLVYATRFPRGLTILPTQCDQAVPVRVAAFTATSQALGMLIEWSMIDESAVAGYHLDRASDPAGPFTRLTQTLIDVGSSHYYLDGDVALGATYLYRLEALSRSGDVQFFGPITAQAIGTMKPYLGSVSPNPSFGAATISFSLSRPSKAILRIVDLNGRNVRVLLDGIIPPGERTTEWDGRDQQGRTVPAGIYFYELSTSGFNATRKLVRLNR
jgi:hypothetical protein